MGAVDEAVKNGIGDGGIVEPGMPLFDRKLAGDESGFAGAAVVDDLKQIIACRLIKRGHAPVAQDQHIDACELCQKTTEAAVGMSDAQGFGQTRDALIKNREALAAGVLSECTGQSRLANAGRAGEQDALSLTDPVAARQGCDQTLVESTTGAVLHVFQTSLCVFQLGSTQQPFKTSAVPPGALAIDQQTEAILEGELVARLLFTFFRCRIIQHSIYKAVFYGLPGVKVNIAVSIAFNRVIVLPRVCDKDVNQALFKTHNFIGLNNNV